MKKFFLATFFVALELKILTLPHSLKKIKTQASWTKLGALFFLPVECLYGETKLCKLEFYSIFGILVRAVFRTQLNIYEEAFRENR